MDMSSSGPSRTESSRTDARSARLIAVKEFCSWQRLPRRHFELAFNQQSAPALGGAGYWQYLQQTNAHGLPF